MSSAPRDDGGRARRRRRRGPPPSPRNDTDHSSSHHQRNQRKAHPQQSPRSQRYVTGDSSDHLRTTKTPGRPDRSERSKPKVGSSSEPSLDEKNASEKSLLEIQNERIAQKKEEEEQKSLQERALKEKEEHRARLEEQRAKRGVERTLNLSFAESTGNDVRERPSDSELRQLDSSLKKCTGFLRKIRFSGVTEESTPGLCSEAQQLNLSRYISEVVSAIAESKLRSNDTEHVITLCCQLYRRYDDFISQLIPALSNVITSSSASGATRDLSVRKASMRLLVEIFVLGMFLDINPLTSVLKQVMRGSKDSREEQLGNLSVLASFVRAGSRTILARPVTDGSSLPQIGPADNSKQSSWEDFVLSQTSKANISSALQLFVDTEVHRLLQECAEELRKASLALSRSSQVRGTADDAATKHYEASKVFYDKALASANILMDGLGKASISPSLSSSNTLPSSMESSGGQDANHDTVSNAYSLSSKIRPTAQDVDMIMQAEHPFEGDEQKAFYTDLLSATTITSKIEEQSKPISVSNKDKSKINIEQLCSNASSQSGEIPDDRSDAKLTSPSRNLTESRRFKLEKALTIDKLLGRLPSIDSKDDVDTFVQQFVLSMEGSRNGIKRLSKALYSVSAQKLNVLPSYSRIAASLQPFYQDIVTSIGTSLEEDFRFFAGKSDIDEKSLAACIKSAQYVGEYVKFGLIDTSTMFDLLSICMKDFSAHRVDIACHLLESCGRYVFLSPSSHVRMGSILETLWRLKSVKNLEARHNALVETAFYAVRLSPGSKTHKKKSRPPLHEYIRHLIYNRLSPSNVRWIMNQFLKLPWDDELEEYIIKKFVKISRARFSTIPYAASLVAALQKHRPGFGIGIVDGLLESIRSGMEKNDGRESQSRIAEIHLLGEMHKSGVVDEGIIYTTLYQIITLGHEGTDFNQPKSKKPLGSPSLRHDVEQLDSGRSSTRIYATAPDPPGDFFRVRLACILVEICGRILVSSNRRKLEVFWIFLERYLFCKTYQASQGDQLPLHISHIVGDVFERILQKPKRSAKDVRLSSRGHSFPRSGSSQSNDSRSTNWHAPKEFIRSCSLEEALRAVVLVEGSPSDSLLISLPATQINHVPSPSGVDGTTKMDSGRIEPSSLPKHCPGSGIRGNFIDGFTTTPHIPRIVDGRKVSVKERNSEIHSVAQNDVSDGASNEFDEDEEISGEDPYGEEKLNTLDEEVGENQRDGEEHDATEEGDGAGEDDIVDADDDMEDDDEEDDEENDEDEDEDDEDEDEDYDDDVSLDMDLQRPKTEEEDAFSKELAAFTAAAVQNARGSSSRVTKFDRMAIPMSLMTQKMEEERAAAAAQAAIAVNGMVSSDDEDMGGIVIKKKRRPVMKSVEFKMLVRKGGKSQLQGLQVPASSSLAVAAKESETADAARHEETKRLVLGSSVVLNDDSDDLEDDAPLRVQQNAREKEESIRQQRSADEMELLATLYRSKPRR